MNEDPSRSNTDRLEMLGKLTQEVDAENPSMQDMQAQAVESAKQTEDEANAKQWGMIMYTVGGFAVLLAPELKDVYSEERCFTWGQQANAVADKYGWNAPSNMPELALIAATAGFAVPTIMVLKQKLNDKKELENGSLVGKIGLWWRHRKQRAAATKAAKAAKKQDVASSIVGENEADHGS